jgi:hypothetical protein
MVSYKRSLNTVFHSMKWGRSEFEFLSGHLGGSKTSKYDSTYLTDKADKATFMVQATYQEAGPNSLKVAALSVVYSRKYW